MGFEDPGLNDIPNDAPTLGKDARQLILQKVASNRWKLINFNISTAFLQGQGDGRKLGIHPPEEIRQALDTKPGDQCQLMGGAYGRIDAPFLWLKTLKGTLESLGFVQSPFDACTFSLITQDHQGRPKVHGVLGIHVDDGLGGGDSYFRMVIQKLRDKYSFGSYDKASLPLLAFTLGNGMTAAARQHRVRSARVFGSHSAGSYSSKSTRGARVLSYP